MNDGRTVTIRCLKCANTGTVPASELIGSIEDYECLSERSGVTCRGKLRIVATLPPSRVAQLHLRQR